MTWTVTVARPAQKAVAGFPAKDQVKIEAAVQAMATDPFAGDVINLEGGGNRWRKDGGDQRDRSAHLHNLLKIATSLSPKPRSLLDNLGEFGYASP